MTWGWFVLLPLVRFLYLIARILDRHRIDVRLQPPEVPEPTLKAIVGPYAQASRVVPFERKAR